MEIGNIIARITADNSGLNSALAGSITSIDKFGSRVKQVSDQTSSSLERIGSTARSVAGILGVSLGAAAFVGFIKGVVNVNDRISDLADQTDMTAQTISGLRNTLENAGSSMETFANLIKRSQMQLGKMTEDGGDTASAVKQLGLNINELKQLSPEQYFKTAGDAIEKFGLQSDRSALQAIMFGRGVAAMGGPVVSKLVRDFDNLKDSALNEETVRALGDIGDGFNTMWVSMQNAAAPVILNSFRGISEVLKSVHETFGILIPATEKTAGGFFDLSQTTTRLTFGLLAVEEGFFRVAKAQAQVFESLSFGTLDFNSKGWDASIKAVEERMAALKRGGNREDLVKGPGSAPGADKRFNAGGDGDAAKKVSSVVDAINKEIAAVKGQMIAMEQGTAAGIAYAKAAEFSAAGVKNLTKEQQALINSLSKISVGLEQLQMVEGFKSSTLAIEGQIIALQKGEAAGKEFQMVGDALAKLHLTELPDGIRKAIDAEIAMGEKLDAEKAKADALTKSLELLDTQRETANGLHVALKNVIDSMGEAGLSKTEQALAAVNKKWDEMYLTILKIQNEMGDQGLLNPELGAMFSGLVGQASRFSGTGRANDIGKLSPAGMTAEAITEMSSALEDATALSGVFGKSFDLAAAKIDIFRSTITGLGRNLDLTNPQIEQMIEQVNSWDRAQSSFKTVESLVTAGFDGLSNAAKGVAMGTQTISNAFKNMGVTAASAISDMIFRLLILKPLLASIEGSMTGSSSTGGWLGSLFGFIGGLFGGTAGPVQLSGPGMAAGGPVSAGTLYPVNEKGMEFFKPNTSGQIIPLGAGSGKSSGGDTVVYNIDARGAQRGVGPEIERAINRSHQKAVKQAVLAAKEDRVRSNNTAKMYRR